MIVHDSRHLRQGRNRYWLLFKTKAWFIMTTLYDAEFGVADWQRLLRTNGSI